MRRLLEVLLVVAAAAVAVTPLPRSLVERVYSRGVYPMLQPRLTAFSNGFGIALFDVVVLVIALGVLVLWAMRLRRASRGRILGPIARSALDTAAIGAVMYFWFLAAWGLNYQREPLRTLLDFQEDRITSEALRELARRNVHELNALYEDAHRARWPALEEMPPALTPAFEQAQRGLGMTWQARPGRPKRSLLDFYFRRVSVDGMTAPFLLETLANQSLLPFEQPFVVAHEWSHLAGYADESEANFLAWLICMRGAARDEYSAWISLYGTIMSALPPRERAGIAQELDAGPRRDLRALADRLARQVNPAASRAGYALYDRFLKANRVQAGIRSYGEVIRLLLGTRFREDGIPVLKGS